MGSCAGAGSGEFDIYRAARRREIERLEHMERHEKLQEEQLQLILKIEKNRLEAEERTRRNAEKRKKKKMKKMHLRDLHGGESEGSQDEKRRRISDNFTSDSGDNDKIKINVKCDPAAPIEQIDKENI